MAPDWAENYYLPAPENHEARAKLDPEGKLYTPRVVIAEHTKEDVGTCVGVMST